MGEMCRTKFDSHFWAGGSRMVWDSNPTPQNDMQFKTYELCISGVFHLIFSVNNWGLTETTESDTWDQRGWPCSVVAFRWKKHWKGPLEAKSDCKMAHLFLCEEAQARPQPETKTAGSKPRDEDNDDAEVIFVGVQHVNEDAETLFVRVISSSKPVISNILNRVTRDASSRRKKGHMSPDPSCTLQPANLRTPASEPVAVSLASQSEWGGKNSPVIFEPSSKPDYKTSSLEAVLHNSELLSLRPHCLSGASLSIAGKDESPLNSKQCPTSDVKCNSGNPKRPKLSNGIPGGPASTMAPVGISPTKDTIMTLEGLLTSPSHVHRGASFSQTHANDQACFSLMDPDRTCSWRGWRKRTFWLLQVRARLLIPWKEIWSCYLMTFTMDSIQEMGSQNRRLTQSLNASVAWEF